MQAWIVNDKLVLGTTEEVAEYRATLKLPIVQTPVPMETLELKSFLKEHGLKSQIDALIEELDNLKLQEKDLTEELKEVRYHMGSLKRNLADLHLRYNGI